MTLQHTRRIVKSLFILFIIVVCIYLLPRVAINAFYYPDNKVYGPTLPKLNPLPLPPKMARICTAGLFPLLSAGRKTPSRR